MASDFLHPQFKMNFWQALGLRLRRNYGPLFFILGLCWLVRAAYFGEAGGRGLLANLGMGPVPGWVPLAAVLSFYLFLTVLFFTTLQRQGSDHVEWGIGKEVETYDA
jgi:uncharacterized membrane protein